MIKLIMIGIMALSMVSNADTVRTITTSDGTVIYQEIEHSDGTTEVIVDGQNESDEIVTDSQEYWK